MKIIGVIPARYASSRFPGKPLADICGKPMIWWTYQQVIKSSMLDAVYVATDDDRIMAVCESFDMKVIYTQNSHPDHIARIQEVSDKVTSDYYICVNGDEPLISSKLIDQVIPREINEAEYFGGLVRELTDPVQVIDSGNLKVVLNDKNEAIYISRTPVPYPKGTLNFKYNKYIGIECFNKKALDFFVKSPMGRVEKIEDIDHLRFIENRITLNFKLVDSESLSVDTHKDLEYVQSIISDKIKLGGLSNE